MSGGFIVLMPRQGQGRRAQDTNTGQEQYLALRNITRSETPTLRTNHAGQNTRPSKKRKLCFALCCKTVSPLRKQHGANMRKTQSHATHVATPHSSKTRASGRTAQIRPPIMREQQSGLLGLLACFMLTTPAARKFATEKDTNTSCLRPQESGFHQSAHHAQSSTQ